MIKGQTTMNKTVRRKLKIEQHEPQRNRRENSGAPETKIYIFAHLLLLLTTLPDIISNNAKYKTRHYRFLLYIHMYFL
jgi:hypothetical protein